MARIAPFKAYRPSTQNIARIVCPPYDVVSREQVTHIIRNNSLSFLRVTRPDGEFTRDLPFDADAVYQRGKENLSLFLKEGLLTPDESPSYYIYNQTNGSHSQTGLVCLTSVDDYKTGVIKKHEKTRKAKLKDRTRHIETCEAILEPIFLTYPAKSEIDLLIENETSCQPPIQSVKSNDGVSHRIWTLSTKKTIHQLEALFTQVPALYIADGHHRAQAAAEGVEHLNQLSGNNFPDRSILSVLFPANQLHILGYHRLIQNLGTYTADTFLEALTKTWDVQGLPKGEIYYPEFSGQVSMYMDGCWYKLTFKNQSDVSSLSDLDVSRLQDSVLQPLLHIEDPRTDMRLQFIGGKQSERVIQKKVDAGDAAAGFMMFPVSIESLLNIADDGKLMPPKSTWFEPKILSGLFLHMLE